MKTIAISSIPLLIAMLISTIISMAAYGADFDKAMDGWTASDGFHIPGSMHTEGGWCHTPGDPGGETYKGITKRDDPHWPGWSIVTAYKREIGPEPKFGTKAYSRYAAKLNHLLYTDQTVREDVDSFYRNEFWNRIKGDQLIAQYLAFKVCDVAINCGTGTSIILLEKCINDLNGKDKDFPLHGVMTDAMVTWLNKNTVDKNKRHAFYKHLVELLDAHYDAIEKHNPSLRCFDKQWKDRARDRS